MSTTDHVILRDLARRYRDVCDDPIQDTRRDLWRRHNSLEPGPVLLYVRAFAFDEMPEAACACADPLLRGIEYQLRYRLFWSTLADDSIFEPWVTVDAVHGCAGWGVPIPMHRTGQAGGSYKIDYPLKSLDDLDKLRAPWHEINPEQTAARAARVREALDGLLPVNVDRGPAYRMWTGDLSTNLGHLRGIEHIMLDMSDDPAGLHRLLQFMSDGVLRTHEQAEAAGDWGLGAHQNQAMAYATELRDPAANVNGVQRSELWAYMAAQEYTAVSPAMHDEFLLQYQLPILKPFALTAYGCCEDLTRKIPILRQIPNLRRIGVSAFANVAACAAQIGTDYVFSYRPSPADMVGYSFNPDRARSLLRRDLDACQDCLVDITLKDVETVQGDPHRVREWVKIVREVTGG